MGFNFKKSNVRSNNPEKKKPLYKKPWVWVVGIVLIICAIVPSRHPSPTYKESTEQEAIAPGENEEATASLEENEYTAIDRFIEKYNALADSPISGLEQMDIQGEDYRVEYRLNAFENAVGKKGTVDGGSIEVVNYGVQNGAQSNFIIRVYATINSYENAINFYKTVVGIFDDSIPEEEISKQYSALSETGSANIYLGTAGHISGYINETYANGGTAGYEIMIDCSDLNY